MENIYMRKKGESATRRRRLSYPRINEERGFFMDMEN